jgi:carbamate kinase
MPKARPRKRETIVIALGGNTLLSAKEKFSIHEEVENVEESCKQIARIIRKGYRVVLTHGNGPQVGDILLQQEAAKKVAPPMPLDVCGAQSQGEIGYLLQRSMKNVIPGISVVSLITQTIVDPRDSAFRKPTKFIGPFFKEPGPGRRKDSDRGFRRVVPSPDPKEIVESQEIMNLVDSGTLVIAAGGGGIPVVIRRNRLEGTEAVIDKDLAAERLASSLRASTLMMLPEGEGTQVPVPKGSEEIPQGRPIPSRKHGPKDRGRHKVPRPWGKESDNHLPREGREGSGREGRDDCKEIE